MDMIDGSQNAQTIIYPISGKYKQKISLIVIIGALFATYMLFRLLTMPGLFRSSSPYAIDCLVGGALILYLYCLSLGIFRFFCQLKGTLSLFDDGIEFRIGSKATRIYNREIKGIKKTIAKNGVELVTIIRTDPNSKPLGLTWK